MNNDLYKHALSIAGINQTYYNSSGNGRYSLMVNKSTGASSTSSTFYINIITNIPIPVFNYLQVRYLLVENAFNYIDIEHFNMTFYPDPGAAYGNMVHLFDRATSYSLSTANDFIMHVINGFDIMDNMNTTDQKIAMSSSCYM
jgi:hypothetical protein